MTSVDCILDINPKHNPKTVCRLEVCDCGKILCQGPSTFRQVSLPLSAAYHASPSAWHQLPHFVAVLQQLTGSREP
jgi:hypothetical protein